MRRLFVGLAFVALSLSSYAVNTFIMPEKSQLLVIDGQSPDSLKDTQQFALASGQHQVVFTLKTLVRDSGDQTLFTSIPFIATFLLKDDQTYHLKGPKLRTVQDTRKLKSNPAAQFTLVSTTGETVPVIFEVFNKSGILIGDDIVEDIHKYNMTDAHAAVPSFGGMMYTLAQAQQTRQIAKTASAETVASPVSTEGDNMSERMLQYWYNQADTNTRARFLEWAAKNQHQSVIKTVL